MESGNKILGSQLRGARMNEFVLMELIRETLYLSFLLSLPALAIGTIVGVFISIIQTATSIQDQSITFIPKLLATFLGISVFGPWILSSLMQFTVKLLSSLIQFSK